MIDPLFSLSGFVVGMLVGMTGVGGGALDDADLDHAVWRPSGDRRRHRLLYAAATKTGGSLVHGFARSIDWRVVGRLATGSVPATVVTLAALSHFNLSGDAARNLITLVLSVALFATAFVLVFGGTIVAAYRARVTERRSGAHRDQYGPDRRVARRARFHFVGWRRRDRCGRADAALSAIADGEDRRVRHRARRAADADCRHRTLDDGLGRLAHCGLAAGWLAARAFLLAVISRYAYPSALSGSCWRQRSSWWRAASPMITQPAQRRSSPPSRGEQCRSVSIPLRRLFRTEKRRSHQHHDPNCRQRAKGNKQYAHLRPPNRRFFPR